MSSLEELDSLISKRHSEWLDNWFAKNASPPDDKIYHYTDSNGLLGILESRIFWGTDIRHLNDTSELTHGIELVRHQLDETASRQTSIMKAFLSMVRDNFHSFSDGLLNPYVSCFCQNGDLLSQWRGYGVSGVGYTIGIRPCSRREIVNPAPNISLRRVIYDPDGQLKLINDSIAQLLEFAGYVFADNSIDQVKAELRLLSFFRQEIGDYLWCFKNDAFSEEQEWRFMYLTGPNDKAPRKIHFRSTSSGITPYVELDIFNLHNGSEYLDIFEIVCGPVLDPEKSVKTIRSLLSSLKYEGVEVRKSLIPLRQ